jgi:nucleoside 2-deoxyribosyltransferase
VPVDLVGHEAADLVVADVKDIAQQRVDAAAAAERGPHAALGHDDVALLDEADSRMSGSPGDASCSIASSKAARPLRLKYGGISQATSSVRQAWISS